VKLRFPAKDKNKLRKTKKALARMEEVVSVSCKDGTVSTAQLPANQQKIN
jgi:hypothetical protein